MDHSVTLKKFYDMVNAGDVEGFGRHLANDFVEREELPGFPPTKAGVIEYFRMLFAAFPDLRMNLDDVIVGDDKAVARVTMTGTHKGPFMGMPPTSRKVEVKLIDIIRFGSDGLAHEHWGVFDQFALMQQLGVIPAEPSA